jgi:response regulator RpfG family c-di-GMP phosphodiesterase
MDGLALLKALRDKDYKRPVVICTGHADKDRSIQALNLHAFALQEKPFHSKELVNTLKNAVFESKMMAINTKLLKLNGALAVECKTLLNHYETRVAAADHLMFSKNAQPDAGYLDPRKYMDEFQAISRKIDILRLDISTLEQDHEQLTRWWETPI